MRCYHICKVPGRVMGIRVLRFSLVVILVLLLVAGALTTLLPNIKEDKMLACEGRSNPRASPRWIPSLS